MTSQICCLKALVDQAIHLGIPSNRFPLAIFSAEADSPDWIYRSLLQCLYMNLRLFSKVITKPE